MDAKMVENNDGYAVELHPTGEIENSSIKKGSFRTANTLTDNTWWGCDLTFDINKNSEGEIRFYLMSTLPNLGSGNGIYLAYRDGKFIYARSRGDGKFGLDYTEKVLKSLKSF
jgi:hypothetical protein